MGLGLGLGRIRGLPILRRRLTAACGTAMVVSDKSRGGSVAVSLVMFVEGEENAGAMD